MAVSENIRVATILLPGGLCSAGVVSGPQKPEIPLTPLWFDFSDGREVLGIDTLFRKGEDPVIHLYCAVGRDHQTVTGCIRRDSSIYLVVEAVIAEMSGIEARKKVDERSGGAMLEF